MLTAPAAADFTVNNLGDAGDSNDSDNVCETAPGNGQCTLRAAIDDNNGDGTIQTIKVPAGEIQTQSELALDLGMTIEGAGKHATLIRAVGTPHRLFEMHSTASGLGLSGLTLRGGRADSSGGSAIRIDQFTSGFAMSLHDVLVTDNHSVPGSTGGGVLRGLLNGSWSLTMTDADLRRGERHRVRPGIGSDQQQLRPGQ